MVLVLAIGSSVTLRFYYLTLDASGMSPFSLWLHLMVFQLLRPISRYPRFNTELGQPTNAGKHACSLAPLTHPLPAGRVHYAERSAHPLGAKSDPC